jgi:hypothetical protein
MHTHTGVRAQVRRRPKWAQDGPELTPDTVFSGFPMQNLRFGQEGPPMEVGCFPIAPGLSSRLYVRVAMSQ